MDYEELKKLIIEAKNNNNYSDNPDKNAIPKLISKHITYEPIYIEECPIPSFIEFDIKDYYSKSVIGTYKIGIYSYLEIKYIPK